VDVLERVDALLEEVEGDVKAQELVQALVELYGEGLARIVAMVPDAGALTEDDLVNHLLLLHDLHPVPLEERVLGALEEVEPYMHSHGGGVELAGVEDGVVRLRLQGSCEGCAASELTLKLAIEDAVMKAAPEVVEVRAEGLARPAGRSPQPAVVLPQANGHWSMAGSLAELSNGGTVVKDVGGDELLFARIEGTAYAYRPTCPNCGASLRAAALRAADLACGCGYVYDLRRAGRCLDAPQLQLEPVPLLVDDSGLVKVAG
jgi:Fe-S cluster biogenesis protein NfuA/nitrite reductase/ring-hydroxylating ferredoxin subunit